MSIYKRGGVYWYEFVFKGERIRDTTRQGNKNVAQQMQAAHRTRLAKGEVGIIEREPAPTLRAFAPRFTQAIETLCANKPGTISFYASKLKSLLSYERLATLKLDQIDEAAVQTYKQHRSHQEATGRNRPLSVASVNRELATLRRLLRLAQEWKVIDRVPRIRLLPGEHEREFVLSSDREKIYLAAAPADLHDVAILLLDTGLRISEGLTLEWNQVHLDAVDGASLGYVTVLRQHSKNSRKRNIPLTAGAVSMLRTRRPATAGLVFHGSDGEPLYQTWLNQQHSALRTLLKLPEEFVPHSLRHTYGTRLGESGADAFTIMRLMGHSSVTISQRYVHPSPESLEKAVQRLEASNDTKRGDKASEVPPKSPTAKKRNSSKSNQVV